MTITHIWLNRVGSMAFAVVLPIALALLMPGTAHGFQNGSL